MRPRLSPKFIHDARGSILAASECSRAPSSFQLGPAIHRSNLDREYLRTRARVIEVDVVVDRFPAGIPPPIRRIGATIAAIIAGLPLPLHPPKSRRGIPRSVPRRARALGACCALPDPPPSHLVARRPAGDLIHYSARSRAEVFILFDNYREAAPRASARLRGPPDRESTVVISDLIISRRRIIPVISARARARERKRVGGGRSRDTSSLDYKGHPWTRILVKRHFVASLNPDNSTLRFCCPADHAAIAFPRGLAAGAGAGARGGGRRPFCARGLIADRFCLLRGRSLIPSVETRVGTTLPRARARARERELRLR